MENYKSMFVSLVSSLNKTAGSKIPSMEGDNILFSRLLSEETQKLEKRNSSSAHKEENFISDKEKESQSKSSKAENKSHKEDQPAGRFLPPEVELSPLLYYLYHLVLKSPDAVSLRDKQAFKLDANDPGKVDIKELQKLLKQKGLDINTFKPEQITQLINRGSKSNLTAYLDQLVKEQRLAGDLAAEKASEISKTFETSGKVFEKVKTPESLDRQEIIQQIIQYIKVKNLDEASEMAIKLNPDYLGQVNLKIVAEGNKVKVTFETTSREVRDIIRDSKDDLTDAFKSQGLVLTTLEAKVVE